MKRKAEADLRDDEPASPGKRYNLRNQPKKQHGLQNQRARPRTTHLGDSVAHTSERGTSTRPVLVQHHMATSEAFRTHNDLDGAKNFGPVPTKRLSQSNDARDISRQAFRSCTSSSTANADTTKESSDQRPTISDLVHKSHKSQSAAKYVSSRRRSTQEGLSSHENRQRSLEDLSIDISAVDSESIASNKCGNLPIKDLKQTQDGKKEVLVHAESKQTAKRKRADSSAADSVTLAKTCKATPAATPIENVDRRIGDTCSIQRTMGEHETAGHEEAFKYAPLDRTTRSIRLIRILPRECVTDSIRCEIRHADVNHTYTCLSYEWGPKEVRNVGRILMNGRVLQISQNLMAFLVYATTKNSSEWYWIDALCINQLSHAEKNHSVQHMGLIYSNARTVLAWLGTDTKIAQFLASPTSSGTLFYSFWSSTYWDRGWVTQELALASHVTLVAGDQQLDATLLPFYDEIQRNEEVDGGITDEVNLSRLSVLSASKTHSLRSKTLIQLLHRFRFKECSVSRDRVYSLRALCGPGSEIKVDYGLPKYDLAGQILRGCHQSLCLCSVRTVCNALKIKDATPCSLGSTLPFVEINIPHVSVGSRDTQEDRFAIDLSRICSAYDGTLEVDVDFRGAIPWFGYRERWGRYVRTTRGSSTCSVQVLPGDKAIVCLSLLVLLDIARLARLAQFSEGMCERDNTASLQLWEPRLQGLSSNGSELAQLGLQVLPKTWYSNPAYARIKKGLEEKIAQDKLLMEGLLRVSDAEHEEHESEPAKRDIRSNGPSPENLRAEAVTKSSSELQIAKLSRADKNNVNQRTRRGDKSPRKEDQIEYPSWAYSPYDMDERTEQVGLRITVGPSRGGRSGYN